MGSAGTTSTAGNDTFNATHLTLNSTDVLVGGAGTDTLSIVDSGTAAWTLPAALVSGIENINVRNVNGSAAVAAVAETGTVTFSAIKSGEYLTVAGVTLVASADLSAAQVASALTGTVVTGASIRGTISASWTVAANADNATQAVYTQTGTAANVADLITTVSGTAQSGQPQLTVLTVAGTPNTTTAGTASFSYNGTTVTTASIGISATTADVAAAFANAINGYAGSAIAKAAGSTVVVQTSTAVSLGGFAVAQSGATFGYAAAPASNVITYSNTATAAAAATVVYNGVTISTATLSATSSIDATAAAVAAAINAYVGSTVAVAGAATTGTVTIAVPAVIGAVTAGTTQTALNVGTGTTSGIIAAAPIAVVEVQGVSVSNVTGATDTVTAANFVGATAFNSENSTSAVTITGVTAAQSVGIIGNGSVTNGSLNFTTSSASVTAATINIAGGTKAGTVTSTNTNLLTATINSTGAANTLTAIDLSTGTTVTALTVNAATNLVGLTTSGTPATSGMVLLNADYAATAALTVTGAATSVAFGNGAAANFKTVDASGMTAGGLTIQGGTNLTSFIGGQGNDTFTTAAAYGASTAGMIAAGAGTADVLVLNAASDLATAAQAALYTGFETLRTAGNQDMSLLAGITAIQVNSATGLITQMSAAQAAAVQVRTAGTTATFALADAAGTSDVLNLSMGVGTTTSAALGFTGAVTMNGFETLNITTNAGSTATPGTNQTSTFATAFVADKLTSIVLKGQAVTFADVATAKAVTINAAALTGNGTVGLTETGNLFVGSTVIGSGIADVFNLGTVGSTYNGGAGDDAFNATVATIRAAAVYNTIDGGAGIDTLTIANGSTAVAMVDDDFKNISNIEKIVITSTGTTTQSIATGGWVESGFKANGLDLATTAGTGAITITASSFSGNSTISATNAGTGVITIATGSGNDKITVVGGATNVIDAGAGNDIIVGGTAVDTITGGLGSDTMTGNGGSDVFAIGATGSVAGTSMDVITDYTTGADTLTFAATQVLVTADSTTLVAGTNVNHTSTGLVTFATADNTLALKIAAIQADAQLDAAQSVAMFVDGANTYVYSAGAAIGNADDQIIQLSGVTGLTTIGITGSSIAIS